MSQDPTSDVQDTPRAKDACPSPLSASRQHSDVDAYMAEQGDAAGDATPAVPPNVLTARQKYAQVMDLAKAEMQLGQTWYIVSRTWFRRWEKACTGVEDKEGVVDEKDVGPVDNTPLVNVAGELIGQTIEHVDVEFVPEEAWKLLAEWCVVWSA